MRKKKQTHIERDHLESAIRGIERQKGIELSDLSELTYQRLAFLFREMVNGENCIPMERAELDNLLGVHPHLKL